MQVLCRESSKHFDWLSEEAMDRMNLCKANPNLKLVFVSMCHSEAVAQKFVNMGIPHVIAVANAEKVKDRTAISFTEIFYNTFFTFLFYPIFWLIFNIYKTLMYIQNDA